MQIFEGPAPKYGMEECTVSEEAWDQLKELGVIDDEGRLMPDEHIKAQTGYWYLICAVAGRLHG